MLGFKIGDVEIKGRLVLGPMAGVTDLPFRVLCKEKGAALTYTEMVSAKGFKYKNKNTEELLTVDDRERPASLQIFGSDPDIMGEMAEQISERNFDILDVNMGCPVPKVVNNGEGSALMKEPEKIAEIVRSLKKYSKKPVTIKIRAGFTVENKNAVEVAKIAEQAGVDAIAVHGRTRSQYYSGKADWNIIKEVKKAVSVPIIGNGDVFTELDAKKMLEETGCDGIMIARGARGNPWIFNRINHYLEKGEILPHPAPDEFLSLILRQAKWMIEYKGEYIGVREMRKHIAWFTAGYPNSTRLRGEVNTLESFDDLKRLMENYVDSIEENIKFERQNYGN